MANKITENRRCTYASAVSKTQDSGYSFADIYAIGESKHSEDSTHTKWVRNNIPPYSTINSVSMGTDTNSISNFSNSLSTSTTFYLTLYGYYRYGYLNDSGSLSTGSGNEELFSSKGYSSGSHTFAFEKEVTSHSKIDTSLFSSGQKDAGLIRQVVITPDEVRKYYNICFRWYEFWNYKADMSSSAPWIQYNVTLPTITLLTNDSNMGTVSGQELDNIYNIDVNSSYQVKANPKPGYRFDKWSDGNENQTRTFTKNDLTQTNTTYTAIFLPYYTISYNAQQGNGHETSPVFYDSIYGALNSNLRPIGLTNIVLPTTMSKVGYTFKGWSGTNVSGITKNVTIPLGSSGNRTYTAEWQINPHLVSVKSVVDRDGLTEDLSEAMVTVTLRDGTEFTTSKTLDYGTELVQIAATSLHPDKYAFNHFSREGKQNTSDNPIMYDTVPDYGITYVAHFNVRKYNITAKSVLLVKEGGKEKEVQEDCALFELNKNSNFTPQYYDDTFYVSFIPKFGYKFVRWKNVAGENANKSVLSMTVKGDYNAVACFEKITPTENSIPNNIEQMPTEEKNELIRSLGDSIINKTIVNYINTTKMSAIGDYAFYGCDKIKFVNIPSVNPGTLGSYAFYGCKNLTSIKLPPEITQIKDYGFEGCSNLTTLIIPKNSVVPLSSRDVFINTPFNNCLYDQPFGYIYVPANLKEDYQSAENWSTYYNHFRAIEDYPEICGI